ncbi:MAG: HNH endonuclease, partial [Armatimonadetes bacterium]|nr:HNH endonuclease [Armatimonadota bacterium]
ELEGDAWEILEEALRAAGRECGTRDRGVVLRHLAETFLLRSQDGEVSSGVAQAPYRVVIHESPVHGVAWVEGRNGVRFVEAEQVEEAHCCGEILDLRDPVSVSGDGASLGTASSKKHAGSTPKGPRLRSAVPPSVRRMVFERDGGRCTMPSCTNRAWNHEHHIHPRSKPGSTNDPSNLTLVCSSCHRALHRRRLFVEGQAPGLLVWKNAKGQVVRGSSGASDGKASAVPAV